MRGLFGILLSLLVMPAMAVEIDGRIDPQEWTGARHVDDFRMTQPLTRLPGSQPTQAWILATPVGLAVGFRNTQPSGIPRTRPASSDRHCPCRSRDRRCRRHRWRRQGGRGFR